MLHTPQISIAQHESPELLFQPRHQQHRNKATALTECIVCTDDPTERIALYERYTEHPGSQKGHFQILDLGNARVIVVAPEFLDEIIPGGVSYTPPFFAGFTVATTDLDAVRAVLAENTIPFHEHHGRLVVRPEDACGSAVLFEQEGTTRH
jgi:hypothetical protein